MVLVKIFHYPTLDCRQYQGMIGAGIGGFDRRLQDGRGAGHEPGGGKSPRVTSLSGTIGGQRSARGRTAFIRALGSERASVWLFAAIWAAAVVAPTLISVLLSFVRARGLHLQWSASLDAYRDIVESGRWLVVLRTALAASFVTLVCLAIGFPFALWLAKRARPQALVQAVRLCLTIPFFLDPSARTLVWRSVLGSQGLINSALLRLHLVQAPVEWLLFSDFAVYLGLIGPYFPNMVWPVYLAIMLIDDDLIAASADLGAGPAATLRHVILPLALPGIAAGLVFTFIPVMGDNIVPAILGGGKTEYLADSVMSLSTTMNYAGAAAFATIILVLTALLAVAFWLVRAAAFGRGRRP
jgi:ABC-type spermidine/putrescine transport system permease subunit I